MPFTTEVNSTSRGGAQLTGPLSLSLYPLLAIGRYAVQLQPLVDVLTVTPVFILFFSATYSLSEGSVGFLRFSRIMKFARVLRLLRLLRSVNVATSVTQDAIQNQFLTFLSVVLTLMVCSTGLVQV